jgi:hypothetical protein
MEVMVHMAESKVHAVHGEALLSDKILNEIATHVIAKVKEEQRHAHVVQSERKMRPNLTSEEVSFWE